MISAVVLTKNEEKNIGECLKTLQWCDEIVVIDDYSTDKTIGVIRGFRGIGEKVKIFSRKLGGDFSAQRNYGLEKARGEWVLFVDADERVTAALAKEIGGIGEFRGIEGFYIKRRDFLFGKWLKHGETRDIRLIRLIRKGAGRWERRVHEKLRILGEVGDLREPLLHYPHQSLTEFLEDINFYTDLDAKEFYQNYRRDDISIVFYPLAKFVQNYFLKLGFLDGMAGFLQATLMSFHSFLTRAKLRCRYDSTFKV